MDKVEFRDGDGTYVLVCPLDEARCRVLDSNVLLKGDILAKDPELSWEEAGEDLGGWTRLGPSDLEPFDLSDDRDRSLLEDLEAAEARSWRQGEEEPDPALAVPDPHSLQEPGGGDGDLRARVERLLEHYLLAHSRTDADRAPDVCCCPGYRTGQSRAEARLHALAALAAGWERTSEPSRRGKWVETPSRKEARPA